MSAITNPHLRLVGVGPKQATPQDIARNLISEHGPVKACSLVISEHAKIHALLVKAAEVNTPLLAELSHLVRLLEPLEQAGQLNVPGLATLNGAREAIANATTEATS